MPPPLTPDEVASAIEEHSPALLGAALGLGLPWSQAQDLAADALAAFLKAKDRYQGRSSVRTFLLGILYRKAHEHRRQSRREIATDPADAVFERRLSGPGGHWSPPPSGPEDEAQARETAALIEGCMASLAPLQRAAFHLKEVEGENSAAICEILDVSDGHLRVLLFRARVKLRDCLEAGGRSHV